LEGEDLGARLARLPKMAARDAMLILRQLCKALDVIHGAGIVHRDIKPGNIFLAMDGGEETVKIFDFGIAKATSGRFRKISRMGTVIGTPRYMSPEQVRGEAQVDHRSDLWSAAVILYKMLVGHFPFNGASTVDLMNNICHGSLPRASELAPELPAAIDDFFVKALSRDPEQRFQSGKQMADALLSVMEEPAPTPTSEGLDDAERPTVPMPPRGEEQSAGRSDPDADTVRLMKPTRVLKPVTLMKSARAAFSAVAATLALVVFLQYAGLGCQGGSSIDPEAAARHGHDGEAKASGGVD
ncbi:MAG TPA: serine/threonine-protein kinase, partial [Candidatus Nanopelagicales bacterium]|nr:serine/threonine-protein kinase [Candidatus Nanopelagicales bacterium]